MQESVFLNFIDGKRFIVNRKSRKYISNELILKIRSYVVSGDYYINH